MSRKTNLHASKRHQAMLHPCTSTFLCTKWTDQLHRDNVSIAILWRQAIGQGHSRATLWSKPTMH